MVNYSITATSFLVNTGE